MDNARQSWIAFGSACLLGLALWTAATRFSQRTEPWDSLDYWTIAYPIAIALCGGLGFAFPDRPWRWALVLMLMQLPVMILGGSGLGLLPLGLVVMAALALPGLGLAHLCGAARRNLF
jgi:hypothetical protein